MTKVIKPAAMSEDHLDTVVGGGPSQSRCEHDDGAGSGGGGGSGGNAGSGGIRRNQVNDLTSYIDASN